MCVLLSVLYALASADSSSVNEKCRNNLTRYDPYLSQYIGKRYTGTTCTLLSMGTLQSCRTYSNVQYIRRGGPSTVSCVDKFNFCASKFFKF